MSMEKVIGIIALLATGIYLADGVNLDRDCDVPDSSFTDGVNATESVDCIMKLNDLADALAKISRCMVMSARPLQSCLDCYPLRVSVEQAYSDMMGPGPGQSRCAHELLDRDQVHMVWQAYSYYADLMELGRCDLCLDWTPDAGYRLKPNVSELVRIDAVLRFCIEVEFPEEKAVNSSAVLCEFCAQHHWDENVMAAAVVKDTSYWQTCRDVMDMLNTTEALWKSYGCDAHVLSWQRALVSLAPVAAALAALAAFYGLALRRARRLEGEREERQAEARRRAGSVGAQGRGAPRHLYSYSGLRRNSRARRGQPAQ